MDPLTRDMHFIGLISHELGLVKKKDRVWNARCPMCGDSTKKKSKKRFFILEKKGKFITYCHNCGESRSLKNFLKIYKPEYYDEYTFFGYKKKDTIIEQTDKIKEKLIEKTSKKKNEEIVENVPNFVSNERLFSLTKSYNDLKKNHPARKYIENRRIPFERVRYSVNLYNLLKKLKIPSEDLESYKYYKIPCVIIPFFKKNKKIEIFQARFFDPKVSPKYLTIKLNEEAKKIYNSDFIDESKTVYIVEGVFDSFFVPNSIAMGGADASLKSLDFNDKIWVFDNDCHNIQMQKKIRKKIEEGEKVIIWNKDTPYNDINEAISECGVSEKEIYEELKKRTFQGLKARLEFANRY